MSRARRAADSRAVAISGAGRRFIASRTILDLLSPRPDRNIDPNFSGFLPRAVSDFFKRTLHM
jgi:hypothetical protein